MAETLYQNQFDDWLVTEGLRDVKKVCRQCGGEIVPPPQVSEMPNPDGSDTSAAYVEQVCAKGHTVKVSIMSWKLLDTLIEMGKKDG